MSCYIFFFVFFQAEDGIRDTSVTGVQTYPLPISCGSACDGKSAFGTHAPMPGTVSSNHDRNAPAAPSASAMVSGRTRNPPRRLYMTWRNSNVRRLCMGVSVQV